MFSIAMFRWVRGGPIGKDTYTYGKVYVALNMLTANIVVVKQVEVPQTTHSDEDGDRKLSAVEALKLENEMLKDLDHPHIVRYLGFEETPTFVNM